MLLAVFSLAGAEGAGAGEDKPALEIVAEAAEAETAGAGAGDAKPTAPSEAAGGEEKAGLLVRLAG